MHKRSVVVFWANLIFSSDVLGTHSDIDVYVYVTQDLKDGTN